MVSSMCILLYSLGFMANIHKIKQHSFNYCIHVLMTIKYYTLTEVFGVLESVKAAADLHLPLGGEVVEVNDALEESPELINTEPYNTGR